MMMLEDYQGVNAMKFGRLRISIEQGTHDKINNVQSGALAEYLRHQEKNETLVREVSDLVDTSGLVDPEDYERINQATYFAKQKYEYKQVAIKTLGFE